MSHYESLAAYSAGVHEATQRQKNNSYCYFPDGAAKTIPCLSIAYSYGTYDSVARYCAHREHSLGQVYSAKDDFVLCSFRIRLDYWGYFPLRYPTFDFISPRVYLKAIRAQEFTCDPTFDLSAIAAGF